MLNREMLRDKLAQLVNKKFRISVEQLEDSMRLNEDLRIDSIMIVQLIVYIELEMKLSVPDEMIDPRAFFTIGSLLEFMQGLEPLSELDLESKSELESELKSKDDDLEVEVKAGETQ